MSTKRNNFLEALKKIKFYDSNWKDKSKRFASIRLACNLLEEAIEGWRKDKTHPQRSESEKHLGPVYTACTKLHEICSQINAKTSVPTFTQYEDLIKASKKLQSALKQASNAKFGIFTFGAVLDNPKTIRNIRRLATEVKSLKKWFEDEFAELEKTISDTLKKKKELFQKKKELREEKKEKSETKKLVRRKSLSIMPKPYSPSNNLERILIGLPNGANYCFLNSAVQQLYHMLALRFKVTSYALLAKKLKKEKEHPKLIALSNLFEHLSGRVKLDRAKIQKCMKALGYKGTQEDSGEYLSEIMLACKNSFSQLKAAKLRLPSKPQKTFSNNIINLTIYESGTLQDCIASVWKALPPVNSSQKSSLVIVLKNSQMIINLTYASPSYKITNLAQEELYLSNIPANILKIYKNKSDKEPIAASRLKMKLVAITIHVGSVNFGHYYMYIKRGQTWYCKNDNKVSKVDFSEIENAIKGENRYFWGGTQPVTLVYEIK